MTDAKPLRQECEALARRKRCEDLSGGGIHYECTDATLCESCDFLADEIEAFAIRMRAEELSVASEEWIGDDGFHASLGLTDPVPAAAWLKARAKRLRVRAEEVSR